MSNFAPMASTVVDSILFRDAFGTAGMREVFSDFSLISRYAEVEIALAKAEARCGVIPAEAAAEIAARSSVERLDLAVAEFFQILDRLAVEFGPLRQQHDLDPLVALIAHVHRDLRIRQWYLSR